MSRSICHLLSRLRRDVAANTLAIVGAAFIPLTAMIGGAVDLSRAYMAKSRLQSACDAASLAARRVMKYDTFTPEVEATGKEFFDFNFAQGLYGTSTFVPTVSRPESGIVRVVAATTVPTVVMKIFGFNNIPINVSCDASLNFVNTDVVLVLDVTGSMADPVGGTPKIEALQEAVMALYDELAPVQTQLEAQGLRLRYGIVPYSSTVNVGRLAYAVDPSYIRSNSTYPSRVANYNDIQHVANTPTTTGAWEYYGPGGAGSSSPTSSTRSSSQCQTWVGASNVSSGSAPSPTTLTEYQGTSSSNAWNSSQDWGWAGAPVTSGTNRSCRRWKKVTTTTYNTVREFSNWTYRQETYDTSSFKQPYGSMLIADNAAGSVPNPGGSFNAQQLAAVGTGMGKSTVSWNGCIEERDTTSSISGGTSMTIPSAAYDLNINMVPNSDATRWRPMLPEVVYKRTAGSTSTNSNNGTTDKTNWILNSGEAYWACPTEARRLAQWTRDDMDAYVSGLRTIGGTYHDIGMIWGARMISTGGIFADGCEEYNGMPCNRHVIFMTDGAQTAYCDVLTAYGLEQNDMRATGSGSCPSQLARHEQRFRMVCNATKNMDVSVWVIGFATALNSNLTGCASNSSQATTSGDKASLIARFRQIGNQIGALRLTK